MKLQRTQLPNPIGFDFTFQADNDSKHCFRPTAAYVNTVTNGINKIETYHVRYPQLFATLAIEKRLSEGIKKGIIWHTQKQ